MQYLLWQDPVKKVIDPTLSSDMAEKLAKDIGSKGSNVNKGTQLRRFFDEIVRLNTMSRAAQTDWDQILPHVHMLLAKVAYAKGRKLVTDEFVGFMKTGIEQIKRKEDLQVFANLFEAFTAFYKIHGPN